VLENDQQEFFSALIGAAEITNSSLSSQAQELYWKLLCKYDLGDVLKAIHTHLENPEVGQFMPKPADIIRYIDGGTETKALTAWARVDKALRGVGAWRTVVFDDAIIHRVIDDMGGWIKLCHTNEEEIPFRANEFQKRYTGYLFRETFDYPPKLVGLADTQNGSTEFRGFRGSIAFIGDRAKGEKVMEGGKEPVGLIQATKAIEGGVPK